jgi:hypothetical protein
MADTVKFSSRRTTEIELPSFPGSKVKIYSGGLGVAEQRILEAQFGDMKDEEDNLKILDKAVAVFSKLIAEWNFVDDEDKPVGVTPENIEKIPSVDLKFISDTATGESKKKEEPEIESSI